MKQKTLLFALAAPLFMVACTNDDFENASVNQPLGEKIQTEGISFTAGFGDAQTRMGFNGTKLTWELSKAATDNTTDKLGLCYLINGQTYTNYEFVVDKLYSAQGTEYAINGNAFDPASPQMGDTDVYIDGNIARAPFASFVTENATIYGGTYVAYYPYNTELHDVTASIPVEVAEIQNAANLQNPNYLGEYAFYVSDPFEIKGGQTEARFTMRQVLPILRFDLTNKGNKALTVSSIRVTADGGMPVAASLNANLSAAVTLSDLKIDKENAADYQLLTLPTNTTVNNGQTGNVVSAYMVVMPGEYKNLVVRARLSDGSYAEKKVESLNLGLNTLQPIVVPMNSDDMTIGNVYEDITDAAGLKAAFDAAANSQNGQIDINIIQPFEVADFTSILPASSTKGAKLTVKGGKITVTGASDCSSESGLVNVTFANDVEFKSTYTTADDDNVTFAGNTIFGGKVTVTDGAKLNIGGKATSKNEVVVGSSTTAATLNILEGATLDAVGNVSTANQAAAHAINIAGTLNLVGNSQTNTPAAFSAEHNNSVISIPGMLNITKLGEATIGGTGTWNLGNGKLANEGKLTIAGAVAALGAGQSAMALTNNGEMFTAFSNFNWNAQNKVNITNNGTYTLTGCTTTNMEAIVKNANGAYSNVNGMEVALTNNYSLNKDLLNMGAYAVTFTVNASLAAATYAVSIPASSTWSVGELNATLTATATNAATLQIQSAGTNAVDGVNVSIGSMTVTGTANQHANCKVEFKKNTDAIVKGTISKLHVANATVTSETGNGVKSTANPTVEGTTSISLN